MMKLCRLLPGNIIMILRSLFDYNYLKIVYNNDFSEEFHKRELIVQIANDIDGLDQFGESRMVDNGLELVQAFTCNE